MNRTPTPTAAPQPISDGFLTELTACAHAMRTAHLTPLESEALLHHLPDLLSELRQRRAAMARSNVLPLHGPRAVEGGRS